MTTSLSDLEAHPDYPRRPCRGVDPTAFALEDGERFETAEPRLRETARRYCAPCPIRSLCQRLGERGEWGMWGGVLYRPGDKRVDRQVDLLTPEHPPAPSDLLLELANTRALLGKVVAAVTGEWKPDGNHAKQTARALKVLRDIERYLVSINEEREGAA